MKNATPYHHRELEDLLEGLLEDLPGDFSDIGYVKELDCGRSCKLWALLKSLKYDILDVGSVSTVNLHIIEEALSRIFNRPF